MLNQRIKHYLQGDVLAKILSLLALLATGAYTTKEDIATFTMVIFLSELAAVFITFAADSAFAKFYRDHTATEVISNYIIQIVLNVAIVAVVLYVVGASFQVGTYQFIDEYYGIILSLSVLLSVSNITRAHLVSLHDAVKVKQYSIVGGILTLLSTVLFATSGSLSIYELATCRILSLAIYVALFRHMMSALIDFHTVSLDLIKKMFRFSVPLLLSAIVGTLNTYMSRIVASEHLSQYEVGIFSFFIMLISSASVLLHSFNQAWYPHLLDLYKNGGDKSLLKEVEQKLSEVVKPSLCFCALSMAAYLVSDYVKISLGGYYEYRYVIFILADSLFFGTIYIIINPLVYIKSKTQYVAYASAIIFVINISLSFVLIRRYELLGASVSFVLITFINFIVYFVYARRALCFVPVSAKTLVYLVLVIVLFFAKTAFIISTT